MNIGLLNRHITIQINTVEPDAIGNRKSAWKDYYACWATISGEGSGNAELEIAGETVVHPTANFTIRWCDKVSDIKSDKYRVKFGDDIYDIINADYFSHKHDAVKLICRRASR